MKPDEIKRYEWVGDAYYIPDTEDSVPPGDIVLAADHDRAVSALTAELSTAHANANEWCAAWNARGHEIAALTERLREGAQVLKELADDINDRFDMQSMNPGMRKAVAAAYAWLQREEST